ncbi:MAG: hypothetical protein FWD57_16425, partial [Polyangiaceae bacterium]|nr:hypothetical protein [Polyangiaceae bacterium]
ARWLLTVLISIALVALVTIQQTRRERTFQATVALRVVEGGFDPRSAPPTSAQLQDYLWEVALSNRLLLAVMEMKEFNLYPGLREIDPLLALDEMRDVLDIRVLRNYFQIERDPDAPPRSARIALSYSHADPEIAIAVARTLASVISEQEAKYRRQSTEKAFESMSMSASHLEQMAANARLAEAALVQQIAASPPEAAAGLTVQLMGIRKRIVSLEDQTLAASTAVSTMGLRSQAEGEELGLQFEVIDPGRIPEEKVSSTLRLVVIGLITFVFSLPITGTAIAAFDLRIYDLEDLRRIGLVPFGHVPAFKGCRWATLNDRLRQANRCSPSNPQQSSEQSNGAS